MAKECFHIKRSLLYIVLLLSCSAPSAAVAQPDPVGTWDVKISGLVRGGGYLTFADDPIKGKTISGYIIINPHPDPTKTTTTGTTTTTTATTTTTTLATTTTTATTTTGFFDSVGFFMIEGIWDLDQSNRIFGLFTGTGRANCEPVDPDTPNAADRHLNVNSFSGTVKNIKKKGKTTIELRIKAKTDTFGMTIVGAPVVSVLDLPDYLSGSWTAKVLKDGVPFREFFSLAPSILGLPNLYDLAGYGANYSTIGCVSSYAGGNAMALQLEEDDSAGESQNARNVSGDLNHKKGTAVLPGWDENMKPVQMNIACTPSGGCGSP